MLKLVYHTAVFGPIDLEYDRPIIRVGRAEDNDLVLRHPSVEAHHCLLLFHGEKVLSLPPSQVLPSPAELPHLTGQELGAGDTLWIGELQFSLAHSATSVALHGVRGQEPKVEVPPGDEEARIAENASRPRFYCAQCRRFVPEAEVKRVGLVGHAKRNLCPKCSRVLETKPEPEKTAAEPEQRVEPRSLHRTLANFPARFLGKKG